MTFSLFGIAFVRTGELNALRDADRQSQAPVPAEGDAPETHSTPQSSPPPDAGGVPPPVVRELIRFADGLRDLGSGNPPDSPPEPVLRWAQERVAALFGACDVVPVEETGPFNPHRHQAVGRRDAPSPALARQIADTVRPGYSWHGALLRPQQVIVYTPADRPPAREPCWYPQDSSARDSVSPLSPKGKDP
jgi:hypothetical protein